MAKVPCIDCGRPVNATRCESCARRKIAAMPPRQRDSREARGYDSKWRLIRRAVLDKDGWVCYKCGADLRGAGANATVDHLQPLSRNPELRLDPNNLRACCRSCNSRKRDR